METAAGADPGHRRLTFGTAWRGLASRRALLMASAVTGVLILGIIGWQQTDPSLPFDEVLYRTLALFVIGYPAGTVPSTLLDIARFSAAGIVYSAVAVFLVQAVRRSRLRRAASRYTRHIVVFGEGSEAAGIARRYRAAGFKVVAIGDLSVSDSTELIQRRIVHLAAVSNDDLRATIRGAHRVIVVGTTDDDTATLSFRVRAVNSAVPVTLLVNDRDLAAEWLRQGQDHAVCRTSYTAIAALRTSPPYREDAMVPPPVVIGDHPVAGELVLRIVTGWHEPGERRVVRCIGWDASWYDAVSSDVEDLATLTWSPVKTAAEAGRTVAAAHAGWVLPPPKFAVQGESIYVACADNARTISVASAVAAARPGARVLGLVDDEATWAGWSGGPVSLVSRLQLLTDPATLELDTTRLLAEEIVADAGRWPFPADSPSIVGELVITEGPAALEDQPAATVSRVLTLAAAIPSILKDRGYVQTAGEPYVLSPTELTQTAAALRGALDGAGASVPDTEGTRRRLLELAARIPVLASRAGGSWSHPRRLDSIPPEKIQDLALEVHRRYLRTTTLNHHATDSANAWLAWDQLSEFDQRSNVAQVLDIPVKLAMLGLEWRHAETPSPYEFRDEQVEEVAIEEHRRWHHFQLRNARVGHDWAIDYAKLSDEIRELDREPVRHMVELLATVGLEIVDPTFDPAATSQGR